MTDFVDAGANTNPDSLREIGIAGVQDGIPGLVLRPGHPIWLTLDQTAELIADAAQTFLNAAAYRFRVEGREIDGVAPVEQTFATGSTVWTLADPDPDGADARTIPGGSQISISDRVFLTSDDATGAPGDTLTIPVVAKVGGSDGSGLTGTPQLLEAYSFVESITLSGVTTGGLDAETEEQYEAKLARKRRHAGRPILPADFSAKALDIVGVARALTLDGYDAVAATSGHDRTVTLAVVDEAGQATSSGVKTAVQALIASEREVNWVVYVIDPTYTVIDVTATVSMYPTYTASDVQARCVTAIQDYLNPGMWGDTPTGEEPDWLNEPTVLRSELYAALNNVQGVNHVPSLTIGRVRSVTAVASTDVFTSTAHGLADTAPITFTGLTGGAPLAAGTTYYVRDSTTNTFKVAATSGGTAIDITTDLTAGTLHGLAESDVTLLTPAPLPQPGTLTVTVA